MTQSSSATSRFAVNLAVCFGLLQGSNKFAVQCQVCIERCCSTLLLLTGLFLFLTGSISLLALCRTRLEQKLDRATDVSGVLQHGGQWLGSKNQIEVCTDCDWPCIASWGVAATGVVTTHSRSLGISKAKPFSKPTMPACL